MLQEKDRLEKEQPEPAPVAQPDPVRQPEPEKREEPAAVSASVVKSVPKQVESPVEEKVNLPDVTLVQPKEEKEEVG